MILFRSENRPPAHGSDHGAGPFGGAILLETSRPNRTVPELEERVPWSAAETEGHHRTAASSAKRWRNIRFWLANSQAAPRRRANPGAGSSLSFAAQAFARIARNSRSSH